MIDPLDQGQTNLRRRRYQTAIGASGRPPTGDDGEETPRASTVNKLSKGQRATLIRLIAQYHYVDVIRDVLAEEYPDFPTFSDELIRYYRRQITASETAEVAAAREAALRTGLANKAVRVSHLIRMANQWRRVPLVSGEGEQMRFRIDVSRELREILKQIAQELGQFVNSAPAEKEREGYTAGDAPVNYDLNDDAVRGELDELLRGIAERDQATTLAILDARRPEEASA